MIWLAIYFGVICTSGFALAAVLGEPRERRRLVEIAGLSTILGCGAVPIVLLWLSMCGFKPQRHWIIAIGAIAIGTIIILWKTKRLPQIIKLLVPRITTRDVIAIFLAGILILFQFAVVYVTALKLPTLEVDGWAIWGLKAKVLYYEALNPTPEYFSDLTLSYSHLDYPLLVPMLWAGGASAIGDGASTASKGAQALPVAGMILLLYASIRDCLPRNRAALLTAVVIGAPAVSHWSGQGLADATLSAFIFAAAISLIHWVRTHRTRDVITAMLLASMAMQTKLEGAVVVGSILLVIVGITLLRARWKSMLIAIAVGLAVSGPWLIWSRDLPHTHEDYTSRFIPSQVAEDMARLPAIFKAILSQANTWQWTPLAVLLIISASIGRRAWRERDVLAGWIVLLLQILAYMWAYIVTPWQVEAIVATTASRLMLHVAPLAALLVAMHWSSHDEKCPAQS